MPADQPVPAPKATPTGPDYYYLENGLLVYTAAPGSESHQKLQLLSAVG